MEIVLYHNHYNQDHLETVKTEMQNLGTPTIKAIWSEVYNMWMAVEGCHRIRAAKALGLTPEIDDISTQKTVIMQIDGEDQEVDISDLTEELTDAVWQATTIDFE
jgi:hypothetical protein